MCVCVCKLEREEGIERERDHLFSRWRDTPREKLYPWAEHLISAREMPGRHARGIQTFFSSPSWLQKKEKRVDECFCPAQAGSLSEQARTLKGN